MRDTQKKIPISLLLTAHQEWLGDKRLSPNESAQLYDALVAHFIRLP